MKKFIGITMAWVLLSMVSFAQETALQVNESAESVKTCIPTKACAKKAGVSLAECKKKCASKTASAETTSADATQVASASMKVDVEEGAKKCCASLKECAAKAGMTVAECKAKCKGKSAADEQSGEGTTKVAAAKLVNEIEVIPTAKTGVKKCCKSAAACTKKQG